LLSKGDNGDENHSLTIHFVPFELHRIMVMSCALAWARMARERRVSFLARAMALLTVDNNDGKGKGDDGTKDDNGCMGKGGSKGKR
jgi:hypothetical protein